jgi:hypothetical protein
VRRIDSHVYGIVLVRNVPAGPTHTITHGINRDAGMMPMIIHHSQVHSWTP